MLFNMGTPLISIIVITFNSEKYVLETLESAKSQTYKNIELIISDDCSNDDTVVICNKWIEKNSSEFQRVLLVSSQFNTGITPNYNRGLAVAKGDWIKFIAGDDILEPNCINRFVEATKVSNDKIFLCGVQCFNNNGIIKKLIENKKDFEGNVKSQVRSFLEEDRRVMGPTLFIHRNTLNELNGFDERFLYVEDYPIIMKFLQNDYRINLLDDYLVKWRIYPESVSRSNPKFGNSIYNAIESYTIPLSLKHGFYLYWYHYKIFFFTKRILEKGKTMKNRMVVYFLRATDLIGIKRKLMQY